MDLLVLPDHAPPRGLPLQHGHHQAPWFDSTELPSITGVSKCCEKRAEASHRLPGLQTNPEAAHGTSTPLQAHLPNRHHQMAPGCPAAPVAVAPTRAAECQQGEKRGNDVPASQGCESPSPPRFSQAALQGATLRVLCSHQAQTRRKLQHFALGLCLSTSAKLDMEVEKMHLK